MDTNDFEGKSDQERIQSLLAEGKVTQEEADRLIAALNDTDVEAEMNEAERGNDAETTPEITAGRGHAKPNEQVRNSPSRTNSSVTGEMSARPSQPRAPEPPERPTHPSGVSATLPEGLRWVRVSVLAGDLDICVDPSLSEPAVNGKAFSHFEVKKDGDDYVIRSVKRDKAPRREGIDGLIDGVGEFVGGIVGRVGDLDIRIPAGFGVVLDSKSGDVDVRDVPFVKANLLAGDLDLRNVGGIDLSMSAGDVDASLRLTSGEHRIKLSAGDVDITLLEGSSVRVTGGVSMGDMNADEPLAARRTGMGGSLSGQVGGGEAKLELSVSAGDVEVRCG